MKPKVNTMKKASFQPMPCPVARALEHIGDGWSLLVLRDAFYGLRRFDEFQRSLGIATNTLTRRLTDLVTAGLLERRPYQSNPPRFEYLLTEAGRDLRPVILTLMAWGAKHAEGSKKVYLADELTGEPVELALMDANTGKRITVDEHRLRISPDADALTHWRAETGQAYRQGNTLVSHFPTQASSED